MREASSSLTREQLAELVGFGRAKVQNILGGQVKPTMDDLVSFARVLKLSKLRLLDAAGDLEGINNLLTYLD